MKEVVSKQTFAMMSKHLTDIEKEKEQILKNYYPEMTVERETFEEQITDYMKKLQKYIANFEVNDTEASFCPCSIIGCVVEIEDLEYNETEKYQIVSPFENKSGFDMETASYLSPMGRALLLKKPNDKVCVETPMGKFSYLIKSIEMPEENG